MFIHVLTICTLAVNHAISVNMLNGTELVANPYNEAVYIQRKPATTICLGLIINETTVFTSAVCEIGTLPVDSYHVVEAPHYKSPPVSLVHNVKTVVRGKRHPFDLKVITLLEPVEFCSNCNASKTLWIEEYDDYIDRFDNYLLSVVLGFGPPLKGGIVTYKDAFDYDCKQDYRSVRDSSWPERMPIGSFCVYEGDPKKMLNITIPNKFRPVTIGPGVPGDDSIGSLVKISDYGRTFGIVIKSFTRPKNLAVAWGSHYLLIANPFEPDGWTPPPPTTSSTSSFTNTQKESSTTEEHHKFANSFCCLLLVHIFTVILNCIGLT